MTDELADMIDESLISSAARSVETRIEALAKHSETANGLKRTFCSDAMKAAHHELSSWMQSTGLKVNLDATGNLIGAAEAGMERPIFMIGSHLDTVVNAGKFDGMLGVLLGVAVVEVLTQAEVIGKLPFDLHIVGFSEEEGVRYQLPFIGSMGIAGCFESQLLKKLDHDGIELQTALSSFGCTGDLSSASYANRNVIAFLETHIEQAVVLQESGLPVGVVSAIAGQSRATIVIGGAAGHAGTVPHDRRKDALAAAAEFVLAVEKIGRQTTGLFATVGDITVAPGLSNVISGRAELRLDLRHESDDVRESAFKEIENSLIEITGARDVSFDLVDIQHSPAVPMDTRLRSALESAIKAAGYDPQSMVSGAGHDAMVVASIAPAGMLFVRCRDGISHHPDEFVSGDDIRDSLRVLVTAVANFAL